MIEDGNVVRVVADNPHSVAKEILFAIKVHKIYTALKSPKKCKKTTPIGRANDDNIV